MAPNSILLQKQRDKAAAKRFFKRVLRSSPVPRKSVIDQRRSYPVAKGQLRTLAHATKCSVERLLPSGPDLRADISRSGHWATPARKWLN